MPSSPALQNINGTLGAVAMRFTRFLWLLNTCVVSAALTSCTCIFESAAPLTITESFDFGKNYSTNHSPSSHQLASFFQATFCLFLINLLCIFQICSHYLIKAYFDREYVARMRCVDFPPHSKCKWIPDDDLDIIGATRY